MKYICVYPVVKFVPWHEISSELRHLFPVRDGVYLLFEFSSATVKYLAHLTII